MNAQEALLGFAVGAVASVAARFALKAAQPYLPAKLGQYPEVVPAAVGLAGAGLAAAGYRDAALGVVAVSGAMLADDLAIRFGQTGTVQTA